MRRSIRTIGLSLLALTSAAYMVACAACWWEQESVIFPVHLANQGAPAGPPDGSLEVVWVPIENDAGNARVEGWFIRGEHCDAEHPGPVVIFFHGNGALIDYSLGIANMYARNGVSVLLPEYRGYGRSAGVPTQAGITADMVRFHDWLIARDDVDRARIIYHGESLGGGVAAALAEKRPPNAIILQSTFTSVAAMAGSFGMPSVLVRHPYRTDRVLGTLRVPTLIIHGDADTIIPPWHAERLHEIAAGSTLVRYKGGHNDLTDDFADYTRRVLAFLRGNGLLGEWAGR